MKRDEALWTKHCQTNFIFAVVPYMSVACVYIYTEESAEGDG